MRTKRIMQRARVGRDCSLSSYVVRTQCAPFSAFRAIECQIYLHQRRGCLTQRTLSGVDRVPQRVLVGLIRRLAKHINLKEGRKCNMPEMRVQSWAQEFNTVCAVMGNCALNGSCHAKKVHAARARHTYGHDKLHQPMELTADHSISLEQIVCAPC